MAEAVLMPKLGMTMDKGTILRWLKKEGEPVQAGEPLLEVMTDKINIEVESEISGTLLKVYYPEEVEVPVNRVIAYIGEAGEAVPETPPDGEEAAPPPAESPDEGAPSAVREKVRAPPRPGSGRGSWASPWSGCRGPDLGEGSTAPMWRAMRQRWRKRGRRRFPRGRAKRSSRNSRPRGSK